MTACLPYPSLVHSEKLDFQNYSVKFLVLTCINGPFISRWYLSLMLLSYKCATCRRGSVQCKSTSRPDPFYFLFCLLGGWAPGLARPSQPGQRRRELSLHTWEHGGVFSQNSMWGLGLEKITIFMQAQREVDRFLNWFNNIDTYIGGTNENSTFYFRQI